MSTKLNPVLAELIKRPFGSWSKKDLEFVVFAALLEESYVDLASDPYSHAEKLGMTIEAFNRLKKEYLARLALENPERHSEVTRFLLEDALIRSGLVLINDELKFTFSDRTHADAVAKFLRTENQPCEQHGLTIRSTPSSLLKLAKFVKIDGRDDQSWAKVSSNATFKELESNPNKFLSHLRQSWPSALGNLASAATIIQTVLQIIGTK